MTVCPPVTAGSIALPDNHPYVGAGGTGFADGRPRPQPSVGERLAEQAFDDDAVAPLAVEAPMPPVDPDLAEAGRAAQREAGDVLREDPRDQLPDPASLARLRERLDRKPADAAPPRRACNVDGELGDSRVR